MPNWCSNSISLTGTEKDIRDFINRSFIRTVDLAFNGHIKDYRKLEPMDNEELENGIQLKDVEFHFGGVVPLNEEGEWKYDLVCEKWGTKWDADEVWVAVGEVDKGHMTLELSYNTAWGPNDVYWKDVLEQYPKIDSFIHQYLEEGNGEAGMLKLFHNIKGDAVLFNTEYSIDFNNAESMIETISEMTRDSYDYCEQIFDDFIYLYKDDPSIWNYFEESEKSYEEFDADGLEKIWKEEEVPYLNNLLEKGGDKNYLLVA